MLSDVPLLKFLLVHVLSPSLCDLSSKQRGQKSSRRSHNPTNIPAETELGSFWWPPPRRLPSEWWDNGVLLSHHFYSYPWGRTTAAPAPSTSPQPLSAPFLSPCLQQGISSTSPHLHSKGCPSPEGAALIQISPATKCQNLEQKLFFHPNVVEVDPKPARSQRSSSWCTSLISLQSWAKNGTSHRHPQLCLEPRF